MNGSYDWSLESPLSQHPHSHMIKIWLLSKRLTLATSVPCHHLIASCDLPFWLTQKVNGEASKESQSFPHPHIPSPTHAVLPLCLIHPSTRSPLSSSPLPTCQPGTCNLLLASPLTLWEANGKLVCLTTVGFSGVRFMTTSRTAGIAVATTSLSDGNSHPNYHCKLRITCNATGVLGSLAQPLALIFRPFCISGVEKSSAFSAQKLICSKP